MVVRYAGPFLIFCLLIVGISTSVQVKWRPLLDGSFQDGITQEQIEASFDKTLVIRDFSVHLWNAIHYSLFNEMMPGAIAGREDWFFTDEEYQAGAGFYDLLGAHLDVVKSAVTALEGRGIRVVLAVLPDKARIMSGKLTRPRPPSVEARYDAVLEGLEARGMDVIDLRPSLLKASARESVFMRTDTHWTPFGAKVVAEVLAPDILAATAGRTEFDTEISPPQKYVGDLYRFLQTGQFASLLGLEVETIEIPRTVSSDQEQGDSLFEVRAVPAALVGTSYSNIDHWGFLGSLQQASRTDILNYSSTGEGPFDPMQSFLDELGRGIDPPEVVVWELPERYFTLTEDPHK